MSAEMARPPNVLVTGASGFVGRHLTAALSAAGVKTVAAARETSSMAEISTVPFDLRQPELLSAGHLRGIDCVYHLAARVHVMRRAHDDESQFQHLNARATRILAQTAAKAGVRRFVYVSSVKVHGERTATHPFVTEDKPAPEDAYGRSKWRAEQELRDVAEKTGLEVVVIRPPLVYGPGVGANFRRLIGLVDAGFPLPFAAVENRRSVVSVWNLVSLLLHVRNCDRAPERAWLVSDGSDVSTPQLMNVIGKALGRPVRLISVPVPALRALGLIMGRRAEFGRLLDSLQIDTSATQAMLNWKPAVGVEEAVARTVVWFKDGCRALE